MNTKRFTRPVRSVTGRSGLVAVLTLSCTAMAVVGIASSSSASAATPKVSLGTAADFAVLAGSTITNTGPTTINGDLGLSPGTAVTGFPPAQVVGASYSADTVAAQAKTDLGAAYDDAAARATNSTIPVELGGTTKTPGVYESAAGTFGITGTLTLDAQGDPNAVFIFKAASTLITASASNVALVNGAQSSNVFWKVGSSATLGTYSTLRGNAMALASITVTTGTTVDGRVMARTAAVTLDSDTITRPTSVDQPASPVASASSLTTSVNPAASQQAVTFTATVVAGSGPGIPSGLVAFTDRSALIGVVALNATGQAVFTTSALSVDLHLIQAFYIGKDGFLGSESPKVYELVNE